MKPTKEDYLTCNATWRGSHLGVGYKISHHGISDYHPEGTWCYYVFFDELMFDDPVDWAKFDLQNEITENMGKSWEHFPYDNLPELPWHGGATFGKRHREFDRNEGRHYTVVEVGCDYAHLWDHERGWVDTLQFVTRDVQELIEEFVSRFKQKERCAYSGKIGRGEEFYTAKNGERVHKTQEKQLKEQGWENWLPVEEKMEPTP